MDDNPIRHRVSDDKRRVGSTRATFHQKDIQVIYTYTYIYRSTSSEIFPQKWKSMGGALDRFTFRDLASMSLQTSKPESRQLVWLYGQTVTIITRETQIIWNRFGNGGNIIYRELEALQVIGASYKPTSYWQTGSDNRLKKSKKYTCREIQKCTVKNIDCFSFRGGLKIDTISSSRHKLRETIRLATQFFPQTFDSDPIRFRVRFRFHCGFLSAPHSLFH